MARRGNGLERRRGWFCRLQLDNLHVGQKVNHHKARIRVKKAVNSKSRNTLIVMTGAQSKNASLDCNNDAQMAGRGEAWQGG